MELGAARGNVWDISPERIDLTRGRGGVTIAGQPKPMVVDLAASAVVVIDMQNKFCRVSRDEMGDLPTARPIAPLERMLPAMRAAGVPVIWLNWGNRADKLNLPPSVMYAFAREGGFRPPMLDKGSWDAEIVRGLTVAADDIHVDKYRVSGFHDSQLDGVLRNLRVATLFFGGVNLDQCVYATMMDAHCLGYDVVLVEDCAATRSPAYCTEMVLYNTARGMGFVTASADVIAGVGAGAR